MPTFGQPTLMNRGNGGSFAQNQPMSYAQNMNRMRRSVGGVNRPRLGAGGVRPQPRPVQALEPAQPLSKPLVNTPPAGPSEQGYGKPAMPSGPTVPKLEPVGGAQMGAVNQVGTSPIAPTNPQELMARQMPQVPVDNGIRRPAVMPRGDDIGAYRQMGEAAGQDMSWMNKPGALALGPSPALMNSIQGMYGIGGGGRPDVIRNDMRERPVMDPNVMQEQIIAQQQPGIGPSAEMFGSMNKPMMARRRMF